MAKPNSREYRCGPLRRTAAGEWYYGNFLLGKDDAPVPGAFEVATYINPSATKAALRKKLRPTAPQPAQTSFRWPIPDLTTSSALVRAHTVPEARRQLLERLDGGVWCPCCRRFIQRYPRLFHKEMGLFLIALVAAYDSTKPDAWVDIRTILPSGPKRSSDACYLVHWGLLERNEKRGYYRPTDLGRRFVLDRTTTVPRHVYLVANKVEGFSEDDRVTIDQVVKHAVDVDALLAEHRLTLECP